MSIEPILKEWYWIVILAAIIMIAFAPSFLKGKCPNCGKRGLKSVDVDGRTLASLAEEDRQPYMSFHRCSACHSRFLRHKSAPLQDAGTDKWNIVFQNSDS